MINWETIFGWKNNPVVKEANIADKVLDKANELQEYFFKKALKEAKAQYTASPTTVQYFYLKEMYEYLRKNVKFPEKAFYDYHNELARLQKTRDVSVDEQAQRLKSYGIDVANVFLNKSGTCETLSYAAMLMSNRDVQIKDFKEYITYKYGILDCEAYNIRGDKNRHTMFFRYLPDSTMRSFTDFYVGMDDKTSTNEYFDTSMDNMNYYARTRRNVRIKPIETFLLDDKMSQRSTYYFLEQNTFSDASKYVREKVDEDGDPIKR